MTDTTAGGQAEPGTIDNPAPASITAWYFIDKSGGIPRLAVSILVPGDLVPGTDWVIDSVVDIEREERLFTVLCVPNPYDEGYERLDEVGEW